MSGRVALRLPAPVRLQAPDACVCTPWFARDGGAVLGSAPALLTFDDADFLERFLAGITASPDGLTADAFPRLNPLRDWAEPPRATEGADGVPRLPASIVRAPIDRRTAKAEGATEPEDVVTAEEAGHGWLRKLYLPTHRHFHLVAVELVCERPLRPRVDPARVIECGAVVRRLRAGTTEVWEDWVPTSEGRGTWAVLARPDMTTVPGKVLDPKALALAPADDTALRTRLGLGVKAPLPALEPVKLNPLPPAQGAGHTVRFGFVPVASRDVEVTPADAPSSGPTLAAEAAANLAADLSPTATAQAESRIGAAWTSLLTSLWGTADGLWGARPDPAAFLAARDAVAALVVLPSGSLDTKPASSFYDATAARDVLLDALFDEACTPRPTELSNAEVPLARWNGGSSSVVSRWIAGLAVGNDVRADLTAGATTVATFLRQLWLRMLDEAVASALPVPVVTATHRYRTLAAVLLWVRNLRIQLVRRIREVLTPIIGAGDGLEPEAREVWDSHRPTERVPLLTVASSASEIEAYVVADEDRSTLPRPWPSMENGTSPRKEHILVHRAALALEEALTDFVRLGNGGGAGFDAASHARVELIRASFPSWRDDGLNLDAQPEYGLIGLDALHASTTTAALTTQTATWYAAAANTDEVRTELLGRETVIVPRYDPDHVYCVQAYARVADGLGRPCVGDRVIWTARTEPFTIADNLDVLGLKPAPVRMPDLGQLLRDLPRIPRAGALPFAPVHTPADSGYVTGATPEETARSWGIAWICSIGIPIFTICAWIVFSIIFSILIAIPGFAWMLLLKICIPVPVPRRS